MGIPTGSEGILFGGSGGPIGANTGNFGVNFGQAPFPGSLGPIGSGQFEASRNFQNTALDQAAPFLTALPPEFLGGVTGADMGFTRPLGGALGSVNFAPRGGGGSGTGGVDILGPILNPPRSPTFPTSGGGGGGSSSGGGGFGDILSSILGGIGGFLGIGGEGGGAGSALESLLPLLLLGGIGFADGDQTTKTRVPGLNADELGLLGINKDLALRQLQAFAQQQGQSGLGNNFINDLIQQMTGAQTGASDVNSTLIQGIIENSRREQINNNLIGDTLYGRGLYQDFLSGGRASADQLANIQGAADSAINAGLSDIGRFRDEGLNNVRLNSVNRGLRPSDTPIQNQFFDVANESNRLAENLVTGIRGQQFSQNLNFPLIANQQRLGQFQAGTGANFARTALQEQLGQDAQRTRLGFGSQLGALNTALLPNQSPLGVAGQLGNRLTGNVTTTTDQSQLNKLLGLAGAAGNLGLRF